MSPSGLRFSDTRFLLILLLPGFSVLSIGSGAAQAGWWTLAILFTVAALDAFMPGGQRSPPPLAETERGTRVMLWVVRLYVPVQLALLVVGAMAAATASWFTVLGLSFAVGFVTGAQGITLAHELGHSRNRFDRFLAWVLMTSVNYSHFMVEHYRGHHPRAATWEDPASARQGESLWQFFPRTLAGSFLSAWRLEGLRLSQHGRSWLSSPLAWCLALNVAVVLALWSLFAIQIVAFWIGQSIMAIALLETVNYIEHYGLQRKTSPAGQREPFAMAHAWNADHVVSNSLLANLQRHSDHHMHAWKPFPTLQALPGPQLPTGYAGCLMLAALPPVWFAVMHPRLAALQGRPAG